MNIIHDSYNSLEDKNLRKTHTIIAACWLTVLIALGLMLVVVEIPAPWIAIFLGIPSFIWFLYLCGVIGILLEKP